MTKSFRESLEEIISALCDYPRHSISECAVCDEAKAALIEVVRELIPPKALSHVAMDDLDGYTQCKDNAWNACREAILKKMEE